MSISKHINGLASTIDIKCNMGKQDKCLSNHNFHLRLPQKTNHHSSETRYAALKWYSIKFQCVFGIKLIVGVGGGQQSYWEC